MSHDGNSTWRGCLSSVIIGVLGKEVKLTRYILDRPLILVAHGLCGVVVKKIRTESTLCTLHNS